MISLPAKGLSVIVAQFPFSNTIVVYLDNTQYKCLLYEFQEKIDSMEREISYLKNRNFSSGQRVSEIVVNETKGPSIENNSEVNQEQKQQDDSKVEETKKNDNASHPRSGNYVEDDVSIEKFFYMGNK